MYLENKAGTFNHFVFHVALSFEEIRTKDVSDRINISNNCLLLSKLTFFEFCSVLLTIVSFIAFFLHFTKEEDTMEGRF